MSDLFSKEFISALAKQLVAEMSQSTGLGSADKKLLSIKDAGGYLGRSSNTISNMIASGEIPPHVLRHFSNRTFLLKSELDKWIEAQQ